MSHQSIMTFMLSNQPAERIKNNFLVKGEIYRTADITAMKEVNILIDSDLYLDVYSKYLSHKHIMEETQFCCPVLEDFHAIEHEDTFEMWGGDLSGIDVNGEYVFLGELTTI